MTKTSTANHYMIVGMNHRFGGWAEARDYLNTVTPQTPLLLVHESDNEHDANAVQVWAKEGGTWRHIAYISRDQNAVLSRFIDQHGKNWVEPQPLSKPTDPAPTKTIEIRKAVDARRQAGDNGQQVWVEVV